MAKNKLIHILNSLSIFALCASHTHALAAGIDCSRASSATDLMTFSSKEATSGKVDAKRKALKIESSTSKVDASR